MVKIYCKYSSFVRNKLKKWFKQSTFLNVKRRTFVRNCNLLSNRRTNCSLDFCYKQYILVFGQFTSNGGEMLYEYIYFLKLKPENDQRNTYVFQSLKRNKMKILLSRIMILVYGFSYLQSAWF